MSIPKISAKKLAKLGGKYPSSTIAAPRKPVKKVNTKRRKSEFARCYGSKARVEFVKSLPCAACGVVGYSENAHVLGNGGLSRKAGCETIAPLCGFHIERRSDTTTTYYVGCHHLFDEQRYAFDVQFPYFNASKSAEDTEKQWKLFQENQKMSDRDNTRYPIRQFASVGDFDASVATSPNMRYAKRFSMDVAEDALLDMGPAVMEFVARRLGDRIEYEHRDAVERTVMSYLTDRAWAEPIIRDAIGRAVHEVIADMLQNSPLGESLSKGNS